MRKPTLIHVHSYASSTTILQQTFADDCSDIINALSGERTNTHTNPITLHC